MWGSLDAALPLRPEESPAPPVSRAALGHLRQWRPFFVVGTLLGVVHPLPWGFGTVACVEATTITGGAALLAGPPPVLAGLLQSLAGMVGASWDLQAEGYRRGEGTDLVAPAEL